MYRQKKKNPWKRVLALSIACLGLDFIMLGLCAARPLQWTSMAYVIALISDVPCAIICCAAAATIMVGTVLHGLVIYEIAWTIVFGLLALFLLQRTISLSFARSVLVAVLMAISIVGSLFLVGVPNPCFMVGIWTFLQIIANIIIANLLLKYTS